MPWKSLRAGDPRIKVAHRIGAGVMLLDMGLEEDIPESQGVQDLKVMHGSHFWARQDAMSEDEMMDALFSGLQIGQNLPMKAIRL